jgi:hypothetical protein
MSWKESMAKMIESMRAADPERLARLETQGFDTSKIKAGRPKDFLDIQELQRIKGNTTE